MALRGKDDMGSITESHQLVPHATPYEERLSSGLRDLPNRDSPREGPNNPCNLGVGGQRHPSRVFGPLRLGLQLYRLGSRPHSNMTALDPHDG